MGATRADLLTIARRAQPPWVSENWSSHNEGLMGRPVGVVKHHTGTPWSTPGDYPTLATVRDGRTGLYNSLSAFGLARSAGILCISEKISWHAGVGNWNGYTDGNGYFFGIEAESDGGVDHWTAAQRLVYPRLVAEILRYCGKDPRNSNWDPRHAQWATPAGRKIDYANLMPSADFDAAVISWYVSPGAVVVQSGPQIVGGIRVVYDRRQNPDDPISPTNGSLLGLALDVEHPCANGTGWYQAFQRGKIWFSANPAIGGQVVWGSIGGKWESLNAERSYLGYPTSGELRTHDWSIADPGYFQTYENGLICWKATIGVAYAVAGASAKRYFAIGGTGHYLGYPITDRMDTGGPNGPGYWYRFQKGVIVERADVDNSAFEVYGDLEVVYMGEGQGTMYLGFPRGPQFQTGTETWRQDFTKGSLLWKTSVTYIVLNEILAILDVFGGSNSKLGTPTEHTKSETDLFNQNFENGIISHNTNSNTSSVTFKTPPEVWGRTSG